MDASQYDESTEETLCPICYEERQSSNLRSYGYKPLANFHRRAHEEGKPCLYMGIELELSHENNEDRNNNIKECHAILNPGEEEENIYAKEDSSLEHGFEIVSHPRTLDSWHAFQIKMLSYLDRAGKYTTGNRDGLHIYLSKKGMTDAHKVRFGAFVSEYQNEIVTIARRRSAWSTHIDRATNGREAAAMSSNHGSRCCRNDADGSAWRGGVRAHGRRCGKRPLPACFAAPAGFRPVSGHRCAAAGFPSCSA